MDVQRHNLGSGAVSLRMSEGWGYRGTLYKSRHCSREAVLSKIRWWSLGVFIFLWAPQGREHLALSGLMQYICPSAPRHYLENSGIATS